MSTTVIASPHSMLSLCLKPWAGSNLDPEQIKQVFEAHNLKVLDTDLLSSVEFIAAAGLGPEQAANLANDLRGVGLTVRVRNDPSISISSRVSNASALILMMALLTFPLIFPPIFAIFNFLYLTSKTRLSVAAFSQDQPSSIPVTQRVLQRISELSEHLPEHVVKPLLSQVKELGESAKTNPDGPAAAALADILTSFEHEHAAQVAKMAKSLKTDLARARQAATEVRQS